MAEEPENAPAWPPIDQNQIIEAPNVFVDTHLGFAHGNQIARVTFGSLVLNLTQEAQLPAMRAAVTLIIPENALLAFAHDVIERAANLGIELVAPSGQATDEDPQDD